MATNKVNREYHTNLKLITCIVQRGKADEIVQAAMKAGAPAATTYFARGTGIREKLGFLKVFISPEKEVIEIVVFNEEADEVFNTMVDAGKLETPGIGFIYMTPVDKALMHGSLVGVDTENELKIRKKKMNG
jgi:nitrogen regulatory protein PII